MRRLFIHRKANWMYSTVFLARWASSEAGEGREGEGRGREGKRGREEGGREGGGGGLVINCCLLAGCGLTCIFVAAGSRSCCESFQLPVSISTRRLG